jgi:hypothetical protein
MAKLTRSNSLSALAEGQPAFSAGTGRFTIGISGREGVGPENASWSSLKGIPGEFRKDARLERYLK